MRTRPSTAGLLILVCGCFTVAACDDLTAGQLKEDPAPPKLIKLIIQDQGPSRGRLIATDLLDQAAALACDDATPCPAGILGYPSPSCDASGACPDPLSGSCATPNVGNYYLPTQPIGAPYDSCAAKTGARPIYLAPINMIRLVFNKALDPTIENVTTDPTTGAYSYALQPGIIELDDDKGMPVALADGSGGAPSGLYYDAGGSPLNTSDPIKVPYGPALVMKPAARLNANSSYSIKIVDATKIVDRKGQAATGLLPSYPFTTEQPHLVSAAPDITTDGTVVLPDDVITLTTNVPVVPGSGVTLSCGGKNVPIEVWLDQGTKPTACKPNKTQIDLVPASAPGMPMDLPLGPCAVTLAGIIDTGAGRGTLATASYRFVVTGPKDPADKGTVSHFVLPEQCILPAMDMTLLSDGGTSG